MKRLFKIMLCLMIGVSCFGCSDKNKKEVDEPLKPFDTTQNIGETVLMDKNGVKIVAKNLLYEYGEVKVNLKIENKTNQKVKVRSGTIGNKGNAINGYMIKSGYLYCNLDANSSVDESVEFPISALELYGIKGIADIKISIDVVDDNYNKVVEDVLVVKTPLADSYDYSKDTYMDGVRNKYLKERYGYSVEYFKGEELGEVSGVEVVSAVIIKNKDGESVLAVEVINNNEVDAVISCDHVKFNDEMISEDKVDAEMILAKHRGLIEMDINDVMEDYKGSSKITSLNKIAFDFCMHDPSTFTKLQSQGIVLEGFELSMEKEEK